MTAKAIASGLFLIAGALMAQDPPSRVARLNLINGPVSFQPSSVDDWTEATVNYPLTTGDHLYTDAGGRAEMHVGSSAIRLNAYTNFGFLNLDDRTVQMRLTEGNVELRLRELDSSDTWEIDTPNGAISLLGPGEYRIDTDPNRNATMVTVRSGEAEVTANGQTFPVHAGQTAYFAGDGGQPEQQSANPVDDFDNFCFDRDRREDSLPAPRYVSREMEGYEDLETHGVWSEIPDYGPVWRPRGVPVGWAPYRDGHWAWVEPWGWTWIDDAPWGFAPFHYGRWAYISGSWGWCPGAVRVARPVYAPALVAFVGGGGWSASLRLGGGGVAWFPLGPREAYVPYYHHSDNYVRHVNMMNVTNINVTNINVNRVYVNQRVPGAVVAVSRTDFVGARQVGRTAVRVDVNSAATARVAEGGPGIAPERVSVFGRAGGAVNVAQPQPAIFNRPVIARTTPPPAAVNFAARQQAVRENGGRPLDPAAIQTLRQTQPQVTRPAIRAASQVNAPASAGGGRADRPVRDNAGFVRQAPVPQETPAAPRDRFNSRPPSAQPAPQNTAPNPGFGRNNRQAIDPQVPAAATQNAAPNPGFGRNNRQDRPAVDPQPSAPQNAAPNPGFGRNNRQERQAVDPQSAAPQNVVPNNGLGRERRQDRPQEQRPPEQRAPEQVRPQPQAAPSAPPPAREQRQERPAPAAARSEARQEKHEAAKEDKAKDKPKDK